MNFLKAIREQRKLSQRQLASLAGVSYKTVQLMESEGHDLRVSTVERIVEALGYPSDLLEERIESTFLLPPDSISVISERLRGQGEKNWKVLLFNFVDTFREAQNQDLIKAPPALSVSQKMKALLASTVETLCSEVRVKTPEWCAGVAALKEPWFVADMESLKPMAIIESPVHFRKRNIFVLGNFLERR